MGKRAKAPWRLITREGTSQYQVDFRHEGKRYRESTGCGDIAAAQTAAARIYAEVVSGRRDQKVRRNVPGPGPALEMLFALWLASLDGSLDKRTIDSYEMYTRAHFLPFFVSTDRLTTAHCSNYVRARLLKVQATTLRKELSALRGFVAWCVEQHHMAADDAPTVRAVPKKATGVAVDKRRKVDGWIELTADEAARILAELPQRGTRRAEGHPIRAYYTVLWETSLRPETVCSLQSPTDYRRGARTLRIRDEADKARFGREVPLTDAARAALDAVCPDAGALFPRAPSGRPPDYRDTLRKAARAAGLDRARARRISDYDFRHGRITHLVAETGDILGVGFLAGHTQATTTNNYAHARKAMAERVLAAIQG